jgi:hypothetical protein
MIVLKIFVAHLVLVIAACGFIIYTKFVCSPPDESFLTWGIFLLIDFPMSVFVLLTSAPAVVSYPEWLKLYFRGWVFQELIWPGLVFQIVGTINWIALFYISSHLKRMIS